MSPAGFGPKDRVICLKGSATCDLEEEAVLEKNYVSWLRAPLEDEDSAYKYRIMSVTPST